MIRKQLKPGDLVTVIDTPPGGLGFIPEALPVIGTVLVVAGDMVTVSGVDKHGNPLTVHWAHFGWYVPAGCAGEQE